MGSAFSREGDSAQPADPAAPTQPPPLAAATAAAAEEPAPAPAAVATDKLAPAVADDVPTPMDESVDGPSDAADVPPPVDEEPQMSADQPLPSQVVEDAPMQPAAPDAKSVDDEGDTQGNMADTQMSSPTPVELTPPPTGIASPSMQPEFTDDDQGDTQPVEQDSAPVAPAQVVPEPLVHAVPTTTESKETVQVEERCGSSEPAVDAMDLEDANGPSDAVMKDPDAAETSLVTQNSGGDAVALPDDGPRPDGPELKKSGASENGVSSGPATEVIPESSHAVDVRLPPMDTDGDRGNTSEEANEGTIRIIDADFKNQGPMEGCLIEEELELLNLDLLWEELAEEMDEAESKKKCTKLIRELLHYFWNQTLTEKQKENVKMMRQKDMFGMDVDQRIAIANKAHAEGYKEMDEEEEAVGQGGAGESIIFKLRCGDKTRKKDTKIMTIEEDVEFVKKIDARLQSLRDHPLFLSIIDEFAMIMLRYFVAKMITGREVNQPEMSQACYNVLKLFAANMSAKLAPVWLKEVWSSFGSNYFEPIAFHCMCEYLELWGTVIPKIPKKRCDLVLYMLQKMDFMIPAVDSHQITYYLGVPGDPGGANDRLPGIMVDFIERVLDTSERQWENSEHIREVADKDGTLYEPRIICELPKGKISGQAFRIRDKSNRAKPSEADPPRSKQGQEVDDWLCERRYLLMFTLNLIKEAVYRIPVPSKRESEEDAKRRKKNVDIVSRLLAAMKRLGWTNVLRGIQIALAYQYNEKVRPDDEILHEALGPLLHFTEGTKFTALSHIAVATYVFAALRKPGSDADDLFNFTIEGSGFEFLTPKRAFGEVTPYLLQMLSISAPPTSSASVHLTNLFVKRIEGTWDTNGTMQWQFGLVQSGRPCTVDGLAKHILRFVERHDAMDIKGREFVYKSFQNLIGKIRDPGTRFSVVKECLLETGLIAVQAQLVTELKNVLLYSDQVKGTDEWSVEQSDALKTRFCEVTMHRYFTPRKNSLQYISPMVSLSAAVRLLALRDGKTEVKSEEMLKRAEYMKKYLSLGKEILRAICACSEIDMKSIPEKLLSTNPKKKEHYEAAKETFLSGQTALEALEHALSGLESSADGN